MLCEECHREPAGSAARWRAYLIERDGGSPGPDVLVFFCPECALREFGPLRTRAPRDEGGPAAHS